MNNIISAILVKRKDVVSHEELTQSALAVTFSCFTSLMSFIFFFISIADNFNEGAYGTGYATLAFWLIILLYKRTLIPHKVLAILYCLVVISALYYMAFFSGAFVTHSFVLPWLTLFPMVSTLLTGKKTAILMFVLCTISFVTFSLYPDSSTPNHWVSAYPKLVLFAIYFFLTLLIGIVSFVFKKNESTMKNELKTLLDEVNNQKEELEKKSVQLEETFSELKVKNKKIVDSIEYAKYIQNSVMPTKQKRNSLLPECFYFYKPKDVVSGDFFWIEEKKGITYFAVVDCTGHGVPGALLSVLGNNMLSSILESGLTDPGAILSELHGKIMTTLQQDETENRDGMDITLCKWDLSRNTLFYSGAKNPLIYVTDNGIEKLKADRCSIGGVVSEKHKNFNFQTQEVHIKESCMVYLFSDGYQDQFGGDKNKKFSQRRMRELFESEYKKSIEEQYDSFSNAFEEWKGAEDQIDDVLLLGVRINPE